VVIISNNQNRLIDLIVVSAKSWLSLSLDWQY
jgi:hypothetical protein